MLLITLAVIAVAAIAYRYMIAPQGTEQAAAPAAPPAPTVTVAKPLVEELKEWSDFTGQFEARESVEIRARVSGYLESVNFTDGQIVKKGDLLFVIEPRPYEIALESAKAQLTQAEAQLQLAQVQLDRTSKLLKNDFASKETFDERTAEVQSATASRDNAIAAVNQAQLNLDYTRVTAPVSGRLGRHEVSVGNLVMGGTGETTLLTTIVSLDPIWLMFNVSEGDGMTYKRLVQKGEIASARENGVQVEGQLMDEKEWDLKGAIDFVDNQYDRSSGTIRVRASFPNPNLFITPGQFGRVRVPMSQLKPTILVPDAAVVTDQSTKMLFTVSPDGTVVPKPVELGSVTDDGLRIIRSGITPDDDVIINGLLRARPGQKVTPEKGTVKAPDAAPASQQ
ncbi:efflux transporter periplasmic adaptor subunit [Methyloceanibacter superfactus]|uniref:Efflux transporter periplasmic adaptor subunit n=1 Tax=Methyloceanibacter superfactus TaxID=1774969 RepID=A0A1E3W712_9HYPH|nr:efflux transporter periplasmic adaptor subunit [Methyloceanibacter superfactus]